MTRTERQLLAIQKWKEARCKGTLVFPTGFGKTKTAMDAIKRVLVKNPTVKTCVIVPTTVLKNQWENKIKTEKLVNTSVLVLKTAATHKFNCNFLIVDEIHKSAALQMAKVFKNCTPAFILGLTATYERLDGREKLIDKYAPVCDSISIEDAVKNDWLSPYKEYKILLEVDLTEYEKANQVFMSSFAFFNYDWDIAMGAVKSKDIQQKIAKAYNCDLKQVQANAYSFNRALQFRKKFIANHPKKLEIAKKILSYRTDKKCITFNGSIESCKKYGFGYLLHSKQKNKENKEIIEKFEKEKNGVLHTSKMANEGLDVSGLSVAIITGFDSSQTAKRQRIGRVIRKEENKKAEIFTLVLKGTVEEKWFAKSEETMDFIEINESELDIVLTYSNLDKPVQKQEQTNSFRF